MTEEKLPTGWTWTTVHCLYDIIGGGTPSTKVERYWQGSIPWITSADIHGVKDIELSRFISEEAIQKSATNLVPQGSLIVVTRVGLGKLALADQKICFSQDCQALVDRVGELIPEYALHYLSQAVQIFKHENRGTTISGVTKTQLASLKFPLAPLNEQRRIVSKIEELFSDVDSGEAALRKTQKLLARYRLAALKAAFTGSLTKHWCEENRHPHETGKELLERILAARRNQWNGRGKYQEPRSANTSNLPSLPEGWVWARMEQLAVIMGGLTKNSKRTGVSLSRPMLRVANVYQNRFELADVHEIGLKFSYVDYTNKQQVSKIVETNSWNETLARMDLIGLHSYIHFHKNYLHLVSQSFVSRSLGCSHLREVLVRMCRLRTFTFPSPPAYTQQTWTFHKLDFVHF